MQRSHRDIKVKLPQRKRVNNSNKKELHAHKLRKLHLQKVHQSALDNTHTHKKSKSLSLIDINPVNWTNKLSYSMPNVKTQNIFSTASISKQGRALMPCC